MIRFAALALAVTMIAPAHAQTETPAAETPAAEAPPQTQVARTAPAPYAEKLLRLSEILGSLHYLRNLCGESGSRWREQMEALLATEKPEPDVRARYVANFNRGYRSFGMHVTCNDSAYAAISRYMKEGEELSREVATRYGN
jgi:uncharacterized protein (TIGR02301 family)